MELSFSTPYTAMDREGERIKSIETEGERELGDREKKKRLRRGWMYGQDRLGVPREKDEGKERGSEE